jgi:hypothetical protein
MMAHVSASPTSPSSRCPELDPRLDEPILKMLDKDPQRRPQTMYAAYEALAAGIGRAGHDRSDVRITVTPLLRSMVEQPAVARGEATEPSRWRATFGIPRAVSRRSRAWALGAGLGAAVLVGILALVGVRRRSAPEPEPSPPAALVAERAPAAPPAASVPPAASRRVQITVRSRPVQAEIYHEDQRLGVTPGPISLPRGEAPQTLVLKAPRYAPTAVEVRPTQDQSVDVTLVFRASAPSSAKLPRDLENPY